MMTNQTQGRIMKIISSENQEVYFEDDKTSMVDGKTSHCLKRPTRQRPLILKRKTTAKTGKYWKFGFRVSHPTPTRPTPGCRQANNKEVEPSRLPDGINPTRTKQ
jgi:hypothetical protein